MQNNASAGEKTKKFDLTVTHLPIKIMTGSG